jgi:uncharacterized membrane protein YeaQ/YmgE (transglycosylase-associated protein family)
VDALIFIGLGVVMGLIGRALLPPTVLLGAAPAAVAGLVGGLAGGVIGDRHLGGAQFSLQPTALILCVVGALIAVAATAALNMRRAAA